MPPAIKYPASIFVKLFRARVGFYIFTSFGTATGTALQGMHWSTADGQTRFLVIMGVLVSVSLTMKALIDDTANKLAKGELPFGDSTIELPAPPPVPGTIEKVHTTQDKTITTPPATQ